MNINDLENLFQVDKNFSAKEKVIDCIKRHRDKEQLSVMLHQLYVDKIIADYLCKAYDNDDLYACYDRGFILVAYTKEQKDSKYTNRNYIGYAKHYIKDYKV